jgi:hypothetical protein
VFKEELLEQWEELRLGLAEKEYQLELEKNTSFTGSVGTLLSLLAGSSILAPFLTNLSLSYSLIISWAIILLALVLMYIIFTENVQNRVTLEDYIYEGDCSTIHEWAQDLIETYEDALKCMRSRREQQRLWVGLSAGVVVIINLCISVFL